MFKLASIAAYWWPVAFQVPSQDTPGQFNEASFDAKFNFLGVKEYAALLDDAEKKPLDDRAVSKRVVIDLRGVQDEGGADLAFSDEMFDGLLNLNGVAQAIVAAYIASRGKAAEKN